jgi:exonuclease SbcC
MAETLNIIVGDWAGERIYETYSGGEQLRIDFAIRFALVELLARRAGAKVDWLTIDEGFGSQAMSFYLWLLMR